MSNARRLSANFRRTGAGWVCPPNGGKDFGVSGSRVEQIITLKSGVLEYPWIIRAYLLSRAETQGVELTPFMALRGNPHDYWFLDGDSIDRGEID